jgi:hypothetical protein
MPRGLNVGCFPADKTMPAVSGMRASASGCE